MSKKYRLFAGARLRALRVERGLRQNEMAERLGISVPYLSQLEHDDRPLTPAVQAALTDAFPLEWDAAEEDSATRRFASVREALADPLFDGAALPLDQLMKDVFSEVKSFAQDHVFADDVCFVGMEITCLVADLHRLPA